MKTPEIEYCLIKQAFSCENISEHDIIGWNGHELKLIKKSDYNSNTKQPFRKLKLIDIINSLVKSILDNDVSSIEKSELLKKLSDYFSNKKTKKSTILQRLINFLNGFGFISTEQYICNQIKETSRIAEYWKQTEKNVESPPADNKQTSDNNFNNHHKTTTIQENNSVNESGKDKEISLRKTIPDENQDYPNQASSPVQPKFNEIPEKDRLEIENLTSNNRPTLKRSNSFDSVNQKNSREKQKIKETILKETQRVKEEWKACQKAKVTGFEYFWEGFLPLPFAKGWTAQIYNLSKSNSVARLEKYCNGTDIRPDSEFYLVDGKRPPDHSIIKHRRYISRLSDEMMHKSLDHTLNCSNIFKNIPASPFLNKFKGLIYFESLNQWGTVFEKIEGINLWEQQRKIENLSISERIHISNKLILDVLNGLKILDEAGYTHEDINCGNIMVHGEDNSGVIIDYLKDNPDPEFNSNKSVLCRHNFALAIISLLLCVNYSPLEYINGNIPKLNEEELLKQGIPSDIAEILIKCLDTNINMEQLSWQSIINKWHERETS